MQSVSQKITVNQPTEHTMLIPISTYCTE